MAENYLRNAPKDFDPAFQRFRSLFKSADILWEDANNQMRIPSRDKKIMSEGQRNRMEADRQKHLLLNNTSRREEADFYPYRYLGSEGFLPGYNFPRLPIRAFIPSSATKASTFPVRGSLRVPNLALRHCSIMKGRSIKSERLTPPPGGLQTLRHDAKICKHCGHFHIG